MSRDDLIDLIRYLDRKTFRSDLEELTDEQLQDYYAVLRARRLKRLLERVQP